MTCFMDVDKIINDLINYNNSSNKPLKDEEYQKIFEEEGTKKAEYIINHLRTHSELENEDLSRYVYLSIGGADGSEVEAIFRDTEVENAILVEISDAASDLARNRSKKLKKELGKSLVVIQGDTTQRMTDVLKKMEELSGEQNIDGLILSIQAVIHELPKRSPGFRSSIFFGQLFKVFSNNVFYGREPIKPERWPPTLELSIGNASSANLKKVADIVNEKLHITKKEVVDIANNYVNIDAVLCLELLHKVIRSKDVAEFKHELGEQLTSVDPNVTRKIIENHIGNNTVVIEPTTTNGFLRAWKQYAVNVKSETGEKLSFPNTHARLIGVSIKKKMTKKDFKKLKIDGKGKRALFIGPHPDDIELGAGGTACKLNAIGWTSYFVIVTKNETTGDARKNEALEAAKILGTDPANVIFLDLPDGKLENYPQDELQQALYEIIDFIDPHLIFGPNNLDKHKDHVAVFHALSFASKSRGFLMYYVLHHIKEKEIDKKVCVDVLDFWDKKIASCLAHQTEVKRGSITKSRLNYTKKLAAAKKGILYEYFGLVYPSGYDLKDFINKVNVINNNMFGMFWVMTLGMEGNKDILLNFVPACVSKTGPNLEGRGRSQLTSKLNKFFPKLELKELEVENYGNMYNLERVFYHENCLFSGGALANLWTFRYLFGYPHFKYREKQFIRHVVLAADSPVYTHDHMESMNDTDEMKTWGAVIVMWGWCIKEKEEPTTVYAAGISRISTYGAYLLLMDPTQQMFEAMTASKSQNLAGIQVNFSLKEIKAPKSVEDIEIQNIDFLGKAIKLEK